jgi:glycosyltransferase involved in cell wall biosynthesis
LSESNSPEGIAIPAIRLLKDTEMLKRYSENALAHSRKFSWEVSADRFNEIIENVVQSRRTC